MTKIVKIKAVDLKQLVEDSLLLKEFYEQGVEGWAWYEDALNAYEESLDEEEWKKYCVE